MAIAMKIDFGPGKPKVIVDDSCVVKTKEEVDRIIEECSRCYYESIIKKERARLEKQKALTEE